jgi:CheY-like chemotaxis protein
LARKPSRSANPLRVLVAEDHPTHQARQRAILEGLGCHVTMVADGFEAIRAARMEAFDLIVLDRNMPVCNGDTAALLIRLGRGASFEVPIACCSTTPRERAAAGIYDVVLAKPLVPAPISAVLHQLVRHEAA